MATTIGSATAAVNIRLGQSPNIKDPALNYEMQLVYNSLHLLSQYMTVLRENLESAPGQNPAESVRFRRTFWAIALQDIAVGAVCSAYNTGIVNGVGTSFPPNAVITDSAVTVGSTSTRTQYGLVQRQHFVALTEAESGEFVQVGVGPGIIQVTGAKCGQIVWGVAALSVRSIRAANTVDQYTIAGDLVNNGGLYFDNIRGQYYFPTGGGYNWEGYWLPGFPYNDSGTYNYNRAFLYPVGICVVDNFVLFSDYKRSDSLPQVILPP